MKQATKKYLYSAKPKKDHGHWEGKYWCDCKVKNYRKWLAKKLWGKNVNECDKSDSISENL
jgi:hypothetical protein